MSNRRTRIQSELAIMDKYIIALKCMRDITEYAYNEIESREIKNAIIDRLADAYVAIGNITYEGDAESSEKPN